MKQSFKVGIEWAMAPGRTSSPRNTVLNDESGSTEKTKIPNLKEAATLTEEPTRVARKH